MQVIPNQSRQELLLNNIDSEKNARLSIFTCTLVVQPIFGIIFDANAAILE
jgi:hypothetical protein